MTVNWIALIGYLAAILVAASFYMKQMIHLRYLAIASNICFVIYAYFSTPILYPVLILHLFLYPLNVIRLYQMKILINRVKDSSKGDYSFEWLVPYMTYEEHSAHSVLFNKGDIANKIYLIRKGRVQFREVDRIIGPGELFGEIGVLSPYKERTATAICLEQTEVLTINEQQVLTLYYQNPTFGLYLLRTVLKRFIDNSTHDHQNWEFGGSIKPISNDK